MDATEKLDALSVRQRNDAALAREVLGQAVGPHEELVWAGRPARGLRLTKQDVVVIPFSLAWGGFALGWELMAVTSRAPLFFCLFGLPFVILGQYVLWGRFFVDAWKRASTYYGLTPTRALVVVAGRSLSIASVPLSAADEIVLTEGRSGRGSIQFGRRVLPQEGRAAAFGTDASPRSFEHVDDVYDVYARVLALHAAQRREPASA